MRLSGPRRLTALNVLLLAALSSAAMAQDKEYEQEQPQEVAESAIGKVGQRQTREMTQTHVEPMSRINNRIANRVQNRIRNRLDRYYDPQANATSPYAVAAEQAREIDAIRKSR